MAEYYLLINGAIVPTDDISEWSKWRKDKKNVAVAKTEFVNRFRLFRSAKKILVSTVCLGLDHGFGSTEKPIIFETMIFGQPDGEEYCERYATLEEARAGHIAACKTINRFWWKETP